MFTLSHPSHNRPERVLEKFLFVVGGNHNTHRRFPGFRWSAEHLAKYSFPFIRNSGHGKFPHKTFPILSKSLRFFRVRQQKEYSFRKTLHIARRNNKPGMLRNILRQPIRIGGNHRQSRCKRMHHTKALRFRRAHHRENIRRSIHIGKFFSLQIPKEMHLLRQTKFSDQSSKRCLGATVPGNRTRNIRHRLFNNGHCSKHDIDVLLLCEPPSIEKRMFGQSEFFLQCSFFIQRITRRKIRKFQRVGKHA